MSLDINEISDLTLSDIMESLETENENAVAQLSAGEAIDRFLIWNGIQGFTGMILEATDSIRAAASIHEIRILVNQATDIAAAFTSITNVFDEYGHMGNPTLKTIGQALRLATTPTGQSLALLKIQEMLK
jgi:hypothetical protein